MNSADSCPNCCRRDVPPAAAKRRGRQIVHGYRCPACGHQWATARSLTAYPTTAERKAA